MSVKKSDQASWPASTVASTARTARTPSPMTNARVRRVSRAHTSTSAGWILIAAPSAAAHPEHRWRRSMPAQPAANSANRIGPTCPSLSAYRNGHDSPARRTISHFVRLATGQHDHADRERGDREADPQPGRGRRAQQPERQDQRNERGRVVEQAETARALERRVVGRLPVRAPGRRPRGRRGSRSPASARRRPGPPRRPGRTPRSRSAAAAATSRASGARRPHGPVRTRADRSPRWRRA